MLSRLTELPAIVGGHLWTVLPEARHRLAPRNLPAPQQPWSCSVPDERHGSVTLVGLHHRVPDASTLLVIVHGLGGSPHSPYCERVALAAANHGWSSLRIGMRGSTGDGEDLYHAGVGHDLHAALAHPSLDRYSRILIVGYSLGGHISLTHALDPAPRVAAVAAVSSPLDLARSAEAIDRRRRWVYRHHVLQALKQGYAAVAQRRELPTPVAEVRRASTIVQWDALAVVPRFGFGSVEHYYREVSVGPHLRNVQCPSLYVGMRHDPMIPEPTVAPSLAAAAGGRLEHRWLHRGGHVTAPGRWEALLFDWLDAQRSPAPA